MTINIKHTYVVNVDIHYYSENGYTLRCRDCGDMDSITERVCEILVKHNFSYSDVCLMDTGEVLMEIERS